MILALQDQRTALYRLFAKDGSLLYIGITNNVDVRFAQHANRQPWWGNVDPTYTRIVWYDSRKEAGVIELAAVRDESPRWNVVAADDRGRARFLPSPTGKRRGRPATGKTPPLNVRVPQHVQDAARAKAEQRGEKFADVVERKLAEYVAED